MTANYPPSKQQKHGVLLCQYIFLISGAHQCTGEYKVAFSRALCNWLFSSGRFTETGLNVAGRQWWGDFILTTVIQNWQNYVNFPDQPFPWDWLFSFLPLIILIYSYFFLWKCYLKVDTTDSWSGDSLEADWDCAEGKWAVFTAAAQGQPVTTTLLADSTSEWCLIPSLQSCLTFKKFSHSDSYLLQSLDWIKAKKKVCFLPPLYDFPCPCHSEQNSCKLCIQVWTNQTCWSWKNDQSSFVNKMIKKT